MDAMQPCQWPHGMSVRVRRRCVALRGIPVLSKLKVFVSVGISFNSLFLFLLWISFLTLNFPTNNLYTTKVKQTVRIKTIQFDG